MSFRSLGRLRARFGGQLHWGRPRRQGARGIGFMHVRRSNGGAQVSASDWGLHTAHDAWCEGVLDATLWLWLRGECHHNACCTVRSRFQGMIQQGFMVLTTMHFSASWQTEMS